MKKKLSIIAIILSFFSLFLLGCEKQNESIGQTALTTPTPSIHRLRRGLPGYLILFAPHAFEPQRQLQSRESPSPLVFFLISTHFTATLGIPLSSPAL